MKNVLYDVCTHLYQNTGKFSYGVIQKVRLLRSGGGSLKKEQKQGEVGPIMCVRSLFKKKC